MAEKPLKNMDDVFAKIKAMPGTTKKQRTTMANFVRTAFINGYMAAMEEQIGISDTDEIAAFVASSKTTQRLIATSADRDTVNGF